MESVPYLDLQGEYRAVRKELLKALEEICESAKFAQGPATSDFETEIRSVLRS
jgi:dTDP-4-amino-4,6-dideoxygalactose transaminase